ncbi:MAG: thioredoxin family protein [Chloroflexi bacterium]|nr:thioredoxin family protein [Chloroflexota bacterium]
MNIGDPIIPFSLPGVDGNTYSPDDFSAKQVLVIIFSCNHCPYVRAWEDRMVQIQADTGDRGVQLIAINANDVSKYPADNFQNMQKRAQEKQFNFPYVFDESQEIATVYAAQRTPEVFVFDAARRLQYHGAIDDSYEDPDAVQHPYLRQALDALLNGQTPVVASTPPVGCTIKWK